MRRSTYAARTIESAAWLLASCEDGPTRYAILARAQQMLNNVWTCEYKSIRGLQQHIKRYWDSVVLELDRNKVPLFVALHGEDVNPPGDRGNVRIQFQADRPTSAYVVNLAVNDLLTREDYDLLQEKAGFTEAD